MKRTTIRGLQREFGLSYATAAGIIIQHLPGII